MKRNLEYFVIKAIEKHNGFYKYDLVEFINMQTKVIIICPLHGIFKQYPYKHLLGCGCRQCANDAKRKDAIGLKKQFNIVHNNFYSYEVMEYIDAKTLIAIICPIHGKFWQLPNNHLKGHGCQKCYDERRRNNLQDFKIRALKIHNNFYNYDLIIEYINGATKVPIVCPIHGKFNQTPHAHLEGQGCQKCAIGKLKLGREVFIEKADKIHLGFYNYDLVEYINSYTDVIIICPIHGQFKQRPDWHLRSGGCPNCCRRRPVSNEEREFIRFLKINNNTEFDLISQEEPQYKKIMKEIRKNIKRLFRPDLIIKYNGKIILVEFNGDFWHGKDREGVNPINNINFETLRKNTIEKTNIYKKAGYDVIEIGDTEWENFIKKNIITENIEKLFQLLKINILKEEEE